MTLYPEVLKKVQAETDVVVGNERLPTMGDGDALLYVNAICKELLRWNVVITLGAYLCAYISPRGRVSSGTSGSCRTRVRIVCGLMFDVGSSCPTRKHIPIKRYSIWRGSLVKISN